MIISEIKNNKVVIYDDIMTDKYTIDVDALNIAMRKQDINIGDILENDKIYVYTPDMKYIGSVYKGEDGHAVKVKYGIMSMTLDLNNPDPSSWATYGHDAVGLTPESDEWREFFGYYPCILDTTDGLSEERLNSYEYKYYEDHSEVPYDVLSGSNTMICFPRLGVKIEYLDDHTLYIAMTKEANREGFSYMAHTYKGNYCDKFYVGAYLSVYNANKLKSCAYGNIYYGHSREEFRQYSRNNGQNYEVFSFNQLTFLQAIYLLKYKGKNPKDIVGYGYVGSSPHQTGYIIRRHYTIGNYLDYIQPGGKDAMKLLGLEDFVGNLYTYIDGISTAGPKDSPYEGPCRDIYISDGNYEDTSSYIMAAMESDREIAQNGTAGALRYPIGGLAGFLRSTVRSQPSDSSSGEYFCTGSRLTAYNYDSSFMTKMYFGHHYDIPADGKNSPNIFCADFDKFKSGWLVYNYGASRLMYMHTVE